MNQLIDGTFLSPEALPRTLQLVEAIAVELGLFKTWPSSMADVDKSIGTGGRDYSTMTSWEADLDNAGVYNSGDRARGFSWNDSTFTGDLTMNGGGTVGLIETLLTVEPGEEHDGTADSGVKLEGARLELTAHASVARTVKLIDINFNNVLDKQVYMQSDTNNQASAELSRCLVRNGEYDNSRTVVDSVASNTNVTRNILNCIVYEHEQTASNKFIKGIIVTSNKAGASGNNFNNTLHHVHISNGSSTQVVRGVETLSHASCSAKNLIVTDSVTAGSGTAVDYSGTSGANEDFNLSSDATAPGGSSLINKSAANQFVSTSVGSEDLHLKSGADAIDTGTDLGTSPSGVELDIDGRDRDAEADTWDMGADEFVGAGPAFVADSPILILQAVPRASEF